MIEMTGGRAMETPLIPHTQYAASEAPLAHESTHI